MEASLPSKQIVPCQKHLYSDQTSISTILSSKTINDKTTVEPALSMCMISVFCHIYARTMQANVDGKFWVSDPSIRRGINPPPLKSFNRAGFDYVFDPENPPRSDRGLRLD